MACLVLASRETLSSMMYTRLVSSKGPFVLVHRQGFLARSRRWRRPPTLSVSTSTTPVQPSPTEDLQVQRLPISIPELSEKEESYILAQVNSLQTLSPNLLPPCTEAEVDAIIRKDFPSFSPDVASSSRKWKERLKISPVLTMRRTRSLKDIGITDRELSQFPSLLIFPIVPLAKKLQAKTVLKCKLRRISLAERRPLLGEQVRVILNDLSETMANLELSGSSCSFDGVGLWASHYNGNITFMDLNYRIVRAVVKQIFPQDCVQPALACLQDKSDARKSINAKFFLRNLWLFQWLIGDRACSNAVFQKLCFSVCPFESLITLNDCYNSVRKAYGELSVPDFRAMFSSKWMNTLLVPSYNFPFSLRMKVLQDIGFGDAEAVAILSEFKRHAVIPEMRPTYASCTTGWANVFSATYVETMRNRLQIIREDGRKLGIVSPIDCFVGIVNWSSLLKNVHKVTQLYRNDVGINSYHFKRTGRLSLVPVVSFKRNRSHPAVEFICKYMGCETLEEQEATCKDLFASKCRVAIPIHRVISVVDFLEREAFSKSQIRHALPILLYPVSVIEKKLQEMRNMSEFAPWNLERETPLILRCCLYLIERDFSFTSDGTWAETRVTLSEDLLKEVENCIVSRRT